MLPRLGFDQITKSYDGQKAVDQVSFALREGEVMCLLGPSGCGKSTSLRIAAGVERADHGTVALNGEIVADTHHHTPPESRGIGLMFQDFALFPHLTVAQNVGFGIKGRGSAPLIDEILERVGLGGYQGRYPHMLSGGEQQRVALARTLAPQPKLILMDEPFSGLDNRLRDQVRDETLALLRQAGASVLLVTHEPEEAMRMADRIALMRAGKIVQEGAPYTVYTNPADRQAAGFFSDINVIEGKVHNSKIETPFGLFFAPGHPNGTRVEVVIRPQHLRLDFDRHGAGPRPTEKDGVPGRARVVRARFMGNISLVELAMEHDGTILCATVPAVFLPPAGTALWVSMRRDRCHVFAQ